MRDGAAAVKHATTALELLTTHWPDADKGLLAGSYDTLAAAYAEAGQFTDAVGAAEKAVALLDPGSDDRKTVFLNRLAIYKRGEPWRLAPP